MRGEEKAATVLKTLRGLEEEEGSIKGMKKRNSS